MGVMVAGMFPRDAFCQVEEGLVFASLVGEVFFKFSSHQTRCWILSRAFSASIEIITFLLSVDTVYSD